MIEDVFDFLDDTLDCSVYPSNLPESASYPAATYTLISSVPDSLLDGSFDSTTSRIQLDFFSTDHAELDSLASSASASLNRYLGQIGDTITFWRLENEFETSAPLGDGSDDWLYQRTQDYLIRWH